MAEKGVMRTKDGLKRKGVTGLWRKLQLLELYVLCSLLHITANPTKQPLFISSELLSYSSDSLA